MGGVQIFAFDPRFDPQSDVIRGVKSSGSNFNWRSCIGRQTALHATSTRKRPRQNPVHAAAASVRPAYFRACCARRCRAARAAPACPETQAPASRHPAPRLGQTPARGVQRVRGGSSTPELPHPPLEATKNAADVSQGSTVVRPTPRGLASVRGAPAHAAKRVVPTDCPRKTARAAALRNICRPKQVPGGAPMRRLPGAYLAPRWGARCSRAWAGWFPRRKPTGDSSGPVAPRPPSRYIQRWPLPS